VELTRRDFEALVVERIDESIELARKVLKQNGYSHDDIDRVVFIGGPTKMASLIREHVPQQLGIPGDSSVDPMTAVAIGAAIFAESRDWSEAESTRKASRASVTTAGPLAVAFDYPARTANEEALLRVRVGSEAALGCEVQIDADTGWTSGRQSLTDGLSLKLPLREVGEHAFRAVVFDPHGRPVVSASSEFVIVRTHASARSIPATQNIAVKVRESEFNERNTLHVFLTKGTPLPASGTLMVKSIENLKSGEIGHIDIELFQQDRLEAPQPELNLSVGSFRIEAKDLPEGRRLRKHDEIKFHWRMDDSGVLTASVELPSLGQFFRETRFYAPQAGHRSFEGSNGTRLAATSLDQAEEDLERATEIVGDGAGADVEDLQERLARQRQQLEHSSDADGNRSITEEARRLRQDVAIMLHKPEHRAAAFTSELAELKSTFNFGAREIADPRSVKRFDELAQSASREIAHGGFDHVERALEEMRAVMARVFWSDPSFVAEVFDSTADESYLALDPELHQRQVEAGRQALARADVDGLRQVVFEMMRNRISLGGSGKTAAVLATILRA
jgi:molecular chaperone DnaK